MVGRMSGSGCYMKGPSLPRMAHGPSFRVLHSQNMAHRLQRRAAAKPSDAPSDDENAIKGDWREFRASLINAEQNESAGTSGDQWSSRWTQENLRLLQEQVRESTSLLVPYNLRLTLSMLCQSCSAVSVSKTCHMTSSADWHLRLVL